MKSPRKSTVRSSRRDFIKTGGVLAAGSSFLISGTKASGNIIGANDRVRMAVAGLNGRGGAHIGGWNGQKNVEVVSLIDPDRSPYELLHTVHMPAASPTFGVLGSMSCYQVACFVYKSVF